MHAISFEEALQRIRQKDKRYPEAAYHLVRESLNHTTKILEKPERGEGRHVTGRELLAGFRIFVLSQFGPLTRTVLKRWGIRQTEDVGNIVFNLVNEGALGATEEDSIEDFRDVYTFDSAFLDPFRPPSKRTAKQSHPEQKAH